MIGRRERQRDARADQAAAVEVVVARVSAAVGQRQRRRDRERVEAVDRAGVAAAVGDVAQRREIAAVVALRAVRQADVVAMPRRRARRVLAGDDPRRDVALRQRAAHRPVGVLADRRAEREVRDAAREVVGREQLLRRVERAGRQQVDLAGERRARRRSSTASRAGEPTTRPNTSGRRRRSRPAACRRRRARRAPSTSFRMPRRA